MTDPKVRSLLAAWRMRLKGDSGRGSHGSAAELSAVPSRDDLERRGLRVEPIGLDELLVELPEFEGDQLRRSEGAELEVVLTDEGLHIWDPAASHAIVIDCPDGALPVVLAQAEEPEPPVRVTLPLHSRGARTIVVLTARGPLDPDLCVLWVSDARLTGLDAKTAGSSLRARIATVRIEPSPRPLALNVAPEPLPPTHPRVQTKLSEAAGLGRAGQYPQAASAYARAQQLARLQGDVTGQLKSALGLSVALGWLGYHEDANRLVATLAMDSVLDAEWGGRLSLHLAWSRVRSQDYTGAEQWLQEATRLKGETAWSRVLAARLAVEGGKWKRALEILGAFPADQRTGLPAPTQTLLRLTEARCLAELGRYGEARAARGEERPSDHQLAVRDLQLRTRLELCTRHRVNWLDVAKEAATIPREATRDPDVSRPLVELASWALEHRALSSAHTLLEHALGTNRDSALLVSTPAGSLVRGFDGRLRASSLMWSDLRELARDARGEVHGDRVGRAARTLQTLLDAAQTPTGSVRVIDDGCLRGAPLQALLELAVDRPVPMRAVELSSLRADEAGLPRGRHVLSLADVRGDLPHARTELPASEQAEAYYGSHATWDVLRKGGELGLLHVAVHTRTVEGLASLELADRLVGASDLLQLDLRGGPLCILSGCTTTGIEADRSSFASALLEAGASGVVTTAWPVEDAEMARFVSGIARGWRNQPAVELVASMRHRLRHEGAPARLWAAPQLF